MHFFFDNSLPPLWILNFFFIISQITWESAFIKHKPPHSVGTYLFVGSLHFKFQEFCKSLYVGYFCRYPYLSILLLHDNQYYCPNNNLVKIFLKTDNMRYLKRSYTTFFEKNEFMWQVCKEHVLTSYCEIKSWKLLIFVLKNDFWSNFDQVG